MSSENNNNNLQTNEEVEEYPDDEFLSDEKLEELGIETKEEKKEEPKKENNVEIEVKPKKRETEKEMFIRWLKECFADENGTEGRKHKKLLKEKTNEVNKQIEDIVREYYVETKKGLDAYTYMDKSMDTYNKLWKKTKTAIDKMNNEMFEENFKNTKEKRNKQFEKEMEEIKEKVRKEIKEKRKQNKNTKISKQKLNNQKNNKKIH